MEQRERKYRGISLDTGKWVYGYGVAVNTVEDLAVIINHTASNLLQNNAVDPKTVTDYTGLKDKNNKDIYEGDWLKRNDGVVKYVFYYEKQGGYYTQFLKGGGFIDPISYAIDRDCEIVGNIYENPELIS